MFVIRDTDTGEYLHHVGEMYAWFSDSLEIARFMEKQEAESFVEEFEQLVEDGETSHRPLAIEEPDVPFREERLESWRCIVVCGEELTFQEVLVSKSGIVLNIDLFVNQEDPIENVYIHMDDPEDGESESHDMDFDGTIHIILLSPQETVHQVEKDNGWFKVAVV